MSPNQAQRTFVSLATVYSHGLLKQFFMCECGTMGSSTWSITGCVDNFLCFTLKSLDPPCLVPNASQVHSVTNQREIPGSLYTGTVGRSRVEVLGNVLPTRAKRTGTSG